MTDGADSGMERTRSDLDMVGGDVAVFMAMVGHRREAMVVGEAIRGIIGNESSSVAGSWPFLPRLAGSRSVETRICHILHGETSQHSNLDRDNLIARLQRRVALLAEDQHLICRI